MELPHTPGLGVAPTIDALGTGFEGLPVSDHVVCFLPMDEPRAIAEHVLAPAEISAAAPKSVPPAGAAVGIARSR
ncbi:hypothetical protein [Amycolatopsis sp. WQ 127309]|uniref:hypothetical protein n=1 Tax=Amycolatopsis sp. WQ 127309 TaxID=2932773 RepID=UPI001FF0F114|nr:hypothetical protein [Amycolatopsis sp. WQ 127309]UOZ04871.1 hypothetical protein MUY22_39540 [Amycolatopsis sp. WQ 127309]